ncbi:protein GLUTAMINE DUMPER 6-like [Miscanthus floridulus]|uniref:protein GLUTAMINE DUMPER 6-like n=1 Tax=Miscanthus floridulus TaxID=154761 RepID=UPI003457A8AC
MRTEGAGGVLRPASCLWRTPTPYILLVVGSIMILIALVLLVLICARNRNSRRSRRPGSDDEAAPSARVLAPLDREPKVAVIMAGERAPSFLASAKPLAFVAPRGADEADGSSAAAVPYV